MALTHFSSAAFDLDGTLLNAHSELTPRTKAALDALHRARVAVIVASGRPFSTIPKEILALPAVRYVATGNGVRIYDKVLGRDVYQCTLAPALLEDILHVVQYYPVGYEFFIQGKAFANRAYLADPAAFGADAAGNAYLTRTRAPFDDVYQFVRAHRGNIDSMGLSFADLSLKQQLWQRLEREFEGIYVTSSVPRLLEVADQRAGKGQAVAVILEHLNLDPSGLVAFGDADNDLGMLQLAGCGVAMANGEDHLKETADRIAPHHDDDGVAKILEALLKEF